MNLNTWNVLWCSVTARAAVRPRIGAIVVPADRCVDWWYPGPELYCVKRRHPGATALGTPLTGQVMPGGENSDGQRWTRTECQSKADWASTGDGSSVRVVRAVMEDREDKLVWGASSVTFYIPPLSEWREKGDSKGAAQSGFQDRGDGLFLRERDTNNVKNVELALQRAFGRIPRWHGDAFRDRNR